MTISKNYGTALIFFHSIAVCITEPQAKLSVRVSLPRGPEKPFRRFGIILSNSFSAGITHPETELRFRIPLFGRLAKFGDRELPHRVMDCLKSFLQRFSPSLRPGRQRETCPGVGMVLRYRSTAFA